MKMEVDDSHESLLYDRTIHLVMLERNKGFSLSAISGFEKVYGLISTRFGAG